MVPASPIFLSADPDSLKVLRARLAACRQLFPSHLPSEEPAQVERCVSELAARGCTRRPVWLSDAAFDCMDELLRRFPAARFIRVVDAPRGGGDAYLEVEAEALEQDPSSTMQRVLSFIGV